MADVVTPIQLRVRHPQVLAASNFVALVFTKGNLHLTKKAYEVAEEDEYY